MMAKRLLGCLGVCALLAGCGMSGSDPPAATAPSPPAATAPTPVAPASTAPHATAPSRLGADGFWRLVAETRAAAGGDTARQTSLLETRLRHLPPSQIAEFASIRHRLDERAYTWNLWGAAYVIEDGCSDDCFRDFRAYLISLGQGPYAKALANPDSLARVVQDAETGDWENADDVAGDAYQAVTGEDIPTGDSDVSGSPRGTPWDDEQVDELVQRYPALAARFR
jgi:Protein of unknown function (DUF4240)